MKNLVITSPEEGRVILEYAGLHHVTPFQAIKSLLRFGSVYWNLLHRIPSEQLLETDRVLRQTEPERAQALFASYVRTYVRTDEERGERE